METETKNDRVQLRRHSSLPGGFVATGLSMPALARTGYLDGYLSLTGDELQAIVQLAYDQFGVLAAPAYDVEAERAPELDPLQMIHDHVNKAHAQQAVNRSGVRALGFASVHGVDL